MTTVKQAGMRVFYSPTVNATIAAQTALAAAPTPYTVILNGISVDEVKPQETAVFDDSSLEDTAPVPNIEYRPGMVSFTKKKNQQTVTLRGFASSAQKIALAIVYPDGSLDWSGSGTLIVSSAAKGTKSDFQNKIPESYQFIPDGAFTFQDHA